MRKYLKEGKYSFGQEDVLGEGSFGKVYRGYNHEGNYWMALKQIQLVKLEKYGEQLKTIILSEISVMRKFSQKMKNNPCPSLVTLEDCFRTDRDIYIAMELCEGGTLENYLKNRKLDEREAIEILRSISTGLEYMAGMEIAHRDLKPENIFIAIQKVDGVEKKLFKVGDFGFAAQKKDFDLAMGTLPYMAPEMFKKQRYTVQVDVWSLGVIAYQLVFKSLYFLGKDRWELQKNIKQMPFSLTVAQNALISPEYANFMAQCLEKNPVARINAFKLLSHPLFLQIHQKPSAVNIFTKIEGLIQQCLKMKSMAEEFAIFGEQTNRKTEFIQIYLLKQAYAMMNRITYTVMHKQDYISIPEQEFQQLIEVENQQQYEMFNEKTQKECILVTNLFNEKYKEFSFYVSKFSTEDQTLISQAVNEDPYSYVHQVVFEKELKKWAMALSEYGQSWSQLQIQCEKMIIIRENS